MGGLFIVVVLAFPRGLAGVMTDQIIPLIARLRGGGSTPQPQAAPAE
jgi:urea transport system permease protein